MSADKDIQAAIQHQHAGRAREAEAAYRRVLAKSPHDPDALQLLGLLLAQTGRSDEAIALLKAAVAAKPDAAEFHNALAEVLRNIGRWDDAVASYRRALQIRPQFADAWNNLGIALWFKGQSEEAIASWERAVQINPEFAQAHMNLGNALKTKGRLEEAIASYNRALRIQPNFAEAHLNLGNALAMKYDFEPAIAAFMRATQLKPNLAEAHNNLGNALRDSGRLDEAMLSIQRAIQLNPNLAEAYNNLGNVLKDQCRLDEAIAAFTRAIELNPKLTEPHWNMSHALLLSGDFKRGWPAYEWRWTEKTQFALRSFPQPQWDGRELNGKTILLHAEQGLGDTIHFVRYVPTVAKRGGRVILECQPALVGLFRESIPAEQIVAQGEPLPSFDVHCPLLSLPMAFGADLNSIPDPGPYLKANPQLAHTWKTKLSINEKHLRVGIAWSGNPKHVKDRQRSIPLQRLAPLAAAKDAVFVSLQKGLATPQTPPADMEWIDHTSEMNDFADTAAVIANLDLLVTVDTSVAHLAAAMGKPVWMLIAYSPDWRWMLGRDDSPWYSTVRLFRQPKFGDWSSVIESVARQLQSLAKSRKGTE